MSSKSFCQKMCSSSFATLPTYSPTETVDKNVDNQHRSHHSRRRAAGGHDLLWRSNSIFKLIGWDPPTPPPRIWNLDSYTRALLVSKDRHFFVTPWSLRFAWYQVRPPSVIFRKCPLTLINKGGRSSDCPILRSWRRSSDCIGRSFSRILEATQSLHRIKSGVESDKIASSIEIYCKLGNCVAWSL